MVVGHHAATMSPWFEASWPNPRTHRTQPRSKAGEGPDTIRGIRSSREINLTTHLNS